MKKVIIMIVVLIVILLSIMIGIKLNESKKETVEINYDEYSLKIKNKESFMLFLWQTGCSHCESFKPKLNEIVDKYNLDVYTINLKKLSEIEYAKIKNKTFLGGTPTLVYVKKGITQSIKLVGDRDRESIIDFFKEHDYIKK